MTTMPRYARKLAPVLALVLLAGCAAEDGQGLFVPLGIEPAAGPATLDERRAVQSAVVTGTLLVGGVAGERLAGSALVEPAAGPVATDRVSTLDRDARRRAEFARLAEARRLERQAGLEQTLLFERWMASRVDAVPLAPATVRDAQTLLTSLGYDPGPVDGFVGPRTRAAVERFQTARGIPSSGQITPGLIEQLRLAL